ncbi:hypothetical protein ADUPG1_006449, partial [Aduncisulcus paluster]
MSETEDVLEILYETENSTQLVPEYLCIKEWNYFVARVISKDIFKNDKQLSKFMEYISHYSSLRSPFICPLLAVEHSVGEDDVILQFQDPGCSLALFISRIQARSSYSAPKTTKQGAHFSPFFSLSDEDGSDEFDSIQYQSDPSQGISIHSSNPESHNRNLSIFRFSNSFRMSPLSAALVSLSILRASVHLEHKHSCFEATNIFLSLDTTQEKEVLHSFSLDPNIELCLGDEHMQRRQDIKDKDNFLSKLQSKEDQSQMYSPSTSVSPDPVDPEPSSPFSSLIHHYSSALTGWFQLFTQPSTPDWLLNSVRNSWRVNGGNVSIVGSGQLFGAESVPCVIRVCKCGVAGVGGCGVAENISVNECWSICSCLFSPLRGVHDGIGELFAKRAQDRARVDREDMEKRRVQKLEEERESKRILEQEREREMSYSDSHLGQEDSYDPSPLHESTVIGAEYVIEHNGGIQEGELSEISVSRDHEEVLERDGGIDQASSHPPKAEELDSTTSVIGKLNEQEKMKSKDSFSPSIIPSFLFSKQDTTLSLFFLLSFLLYPSVFSLELTPIDLVPGYILVQQALKRKKEEFMKQVRNVVRGKSSGPVHQGTDKVCSIFEMSDDPRKQGKKKKRSTPELTPTDLYTDTSVFTSLYLSCLHAFPPFCSLAEPLSHHFPSLDDLSQTCLFPSLSATFSDPSSTALSLLSSLSSLSLSLSTKLSPLWMLSWMTMWGGETWRLRVLDVMAMKKRNDNVRMKQRMREREIRRDKERRASILGDDGVSGVRRKKGILKPIVDHRIASLLSIPTRLEVGTIRTGSRLASSSTKHIDQTRQPSYTSIILDSLPKQTLVLSDSLVELFSQKKFPLHMFSVRTFSYSSSLTRPMVLSLLSAWQRIARNKEKVPLASRCMRTMSHASLSRSHSRAPSQSRSISRSQSITRSDAPSKDVEEGSSFDDATDDRFVTHDGFIERVDYRGKKHEEDAHRTMDSLDAMKRSIVDDEEEEDHLLQIERYRQHVEAYFTSPHGSPSPHRFAHSTYPSSVSLAADIAMLEELSNSDSDQMGSLRGMGVEKSKHDNGLHEGSTIAISDTGSDNACGIRRLFAFCQCCNGSKPQARQDWTISHSLPLISTLNIALSHKLLSSKPLSVLKPIIRPALQPMKIKGKLDIPKLSFLLNSISSISKLMYILARIPPPCYLTSLDFLRFPQPLLFLSSSSSLFFFYVSLLFLPKTSFSTLACSLAAAIFSPREFDTSVTNLFWREEIRFREEHRDPVRLKGKDILGVIPKIQSCPSSSDKVSPSFHPLLAFSQDLPPISGLSVTSSSSQPHVTFSAKKSVSLKSVFGSNTTVE